MALYGRKADDRAIADAAQALFTLGQPKAAADLLVSRLAHCDRPSVLYRKARFEFAAGDLDAAFEGFCHRDRHDKGHASKDSLDRWGGGLPEGKMLAWAPEGIGVGAEIMHLGFVPAISKLFDGLGVVVDDRLVPLLKNAMPKLAAYERSTFGDVEARSFRAQTSLMSLGWLCRLITNGYDRQARYLGAGSRAVADVRNRLSISANAAVGFSWKTTNPGGGTREWTGAPTAIQGLIGRGVTCISLQHGATAAEQHAFEALGAVFPKIDPYDIRGLADHIAAVDAVITAPNSVAHLAGALGKRSLVVVEPYTCWEWTPFDGASFWYPRTRIARQGADVEAWLAQGGNLTLGGY